MASEAQNTKETAPAVLVADEVPGMVVALAYDFPHGFLVRRHHHRRRQLVFSAGGVMTVHTAAGRWVLPAGRALWIPEGVEHSIRTTGNVHLRTIYFDPQTVGSLPTECRVLEVSGLLRELILRAVEVGPTLWTESGATASQPLVDLLFDELEKAHRAPLRALHLPEGSDPRLRRVTDGLSRDPADPATLEDWGRRAGASARTLTRLFVEETGLTFSRWRQKARLQRALELLALGHNVSEVAIDVGYDSLSAFINSFRQATGQTPGSYRSAARGAPPHEVRSAPPSPL